MFGLFLQHRRLCVLTLLALSALGGVLLWQWRQPAPGPSIALFPLAAPAPAEPPPAPIARPSSTASAPPYTGAAVQTIAADPDILKQVPAETYERSKAELADFAVKLAESPRQPDDWIRVAFIKRFYGDYAGAADAYEYINLIAEGDGLPFYNLAGLYGYYLKEPALAIPKYEAAIQRDPMNPSFYHGFASFYLEVLHDAPSAERMFLQGLEKIPTDVDLIVALAALYRDAGNVPKAIAYYERALGVGTLPPANREAVEADLARLKAAPSR